MLLSTAKSKVGLYNQSKRKVYKKSAVYLPVYKHKHQIITAIESNRIIIVTGTTGSGKSTQVPQYILDSKSKYVNIVCTQPRRLAAVSLALRVQQERRDECVGYHISGKNNVTVNTKLTYMTTGVLLEHMKSNSLLSTITHIILDEVHERHIEDDLLLSLLLQVMRINRQLVLVIMSATLNVHKYQLYFNEFSVATNSVVSLDRRRDECHSIPVIEILCKVYPIQLFYLNDITSMFNLTGSLLDSILDQPQRPMLTPSRKNLLSEMIISLHSKLPLNQAILVFLSGLSSILETADSLSLFESANTLDIHLLHSTITIEDQSRIIKPPIVGMRKIVLSTNVAESSLTIADAFVVIDTCLRKDVFVSSETSCLNEDWISKSCGIQRMGRVGRTCAGVVYRFVTRDVYDGFSDEVCPEIQRVDLSSVVLRLFSIVKFNFYTVLNSCIDPPGDVNVRNALDSLTSMRALVYTDDGYTPTRLGRIVSNTPLDLNHAMFAILGMLFGIGDHAIIAACILQCKSVFIESPVVELETSKANARFHRGYQSDKFVLGSDLFSNLRGFLYWKQQAGSLSGEEERRWCLSHFQSQFYLQEIHDLTILVRDSFSRYGLCSAPSLEERRLLHRKRKDAFVDDLVDRDRFEDGFNNERERGDEVDEELLEAIKAFRLDFNNKRSVDSGNAYLHLRDPSQYMSTGLTDIQLKEEPNTLLLGLFLVSCYYKNSLKVKEYEEKLALFPEEFDPARSVQFHATVLPRKVDFCRFLNDKIGRVGKYVVGEEEGNQVANVEFDGDGKGWRFSAPLGKEALAFVSEKVEEEEGITIRKQSADPIDAIYLSYKNRLFWRSINTYNFYNPGQIWTPRLSCIKSSFPHPILIPSLLPSHPNSPVLINRVSLFYPILTSHAESTSYTFVPCRLQAINRGIRWLAQFTTCVLQKESLKIDPVDVMLYILYKESAPSVIDLGGVVVGLSTVGGLSGESEGRVRGFREYVERELFGLDKVDGGEGKRGGVEEQVEQGKLLEEFLEGLLKE